MNKRYELVRYTAYNVTGMKLHLEKMARSGWLIDHINNNFWCYKKIEPTNLSFTVSYFAKASAFEPEKSAGQETFEEMAAHDGWKLMAENAKLQIYANENQDATPMYTDAESEVNAIIKSTKSFIYTAIMLIAIVGLNFFSVFRGFKADPLMFLADMSLLFITIGVIILLVNMLSILIRYFIWKHKALKAIEDDEFIETAKSDFSFQTQIVVIAMVVMLSGVIASGNLAMASMMLCTFFGIMIMYFIVDAFRNLLRKKKVDKDTNLFFTIFVDIALALVLAFAVTSFAINTDVNDSYNGNQVLMKTSDFIDGESDKMLNEYKESPFIRYNYAYSYATVNENFSYKVIDVKLESLEAFALEKMLDSYHDYGLSYDEEGRPIKEGNYYYQEIDAAMFKADKAYQLWGYDNARNDYLIKYGKRLVELKFSWEIDEDVKLKVANVLK